MTVAVIPADGTEPVATFPDMETAMAWGLQQYKGSPFIVRVYTDEQEAAVEPPRAAARRRPAAKASAVSNILRTVHKAAQEDLKREAGSLRKAAAH